MSGTDMSTSCRFTPEQVRDWEDRIAKMLDSMIEIDKALVYLTLKRSGMDIVKAEQIVRRVRGY